MLKLGIIGTNWITDQFIQAAHETGEWQLTTVYSRTIAKAKEFGQKYPQVTEYFADLDEFFTQGSFDAVYIASPNSLHFQQVKQAIAADKHVIVEKPAFSNPFEMKEILQLLKQKPEVYFFEAARHIYDPNFQAVKEAVQNLQVIQGANLTFAQYSSRYDAVLAGQEPNIFSPRFSGGCLQDLGVYLVYCAIAWFGMPTSCEYHPIMLSTGVDGKGVALLHYPKFDVTLSMAKTVNSHMPGEIYGLKEVIQLDHSANIAQAYVDDGQGNVTQISQTPTQNPMFDEAKSFAQMLKDPASLTNKQRQEDLLALSVQVNEVLYQLRQSAKIVFEADYKYLDTTE